MNRLVLLEINKIYARLTNEMFEICLVSGF